MVYRDEGTSGQHYCPLYKHKHSVISGNNMSMVEQQIAKQTLTNRHVLSLSAGPRTNCCGTKPAFIFKLTIIRLSNFSILLHPLVLGNVVSVVLKNSFREIISTGPLGILGNVVCVKAFELHPFFS